MMSRVKGLLKREQSGMRREGEGDTVEGCREARGEWIEKERESTPYLYSGSPSSSTAFIFPIKVVI